MKDARRAADAALRAPAPARPPDTSDQRMTHPQSPKGDTPLLLRRERMLAVIRERDYVGVAELSERFGISEVTVRSDLAALASGGDVLRIRGGAVARRLPDHERSVEESQKDFAEEKLAIAHAASELVRDG